MFFILEVLYLYLLYFPNKSSRCYNTESVNVKLGIKAHYLKSKNQIHYFFSIINKHK